MCGICGFYHRAEAPAIQADLQAMTDSLRHRGPDAQAVWMDARRGVGLGHTRLSIIDLAGGKQPMASADERYIIVFNGEIYNFPELRSTLQGLGHQFRTNSDTEALLAGYRQWGSDCLTRLRGMFAFAIYDRSADTLFLARDRTGIKPLYYHSGPNGVAFASELKALLDLQDIPRRLDYAALADYLVLGYPLLPATFFRDLNELEPGTWLIASPAGMSRGRFWAWDRTPVVRDEQEAMPQAENALTDSLREHLIADVPIGALLSGGIDSSLLVAMLVKALRQDIQTFTVGFADPAYDESPYAQVVAEHLGTRHRAIRLDVVADTSLVENVLRQFDQPFGDSSAIPTFLICREIRKHVKVVIGGDGGDEMFGGYPRFRYADLAKRIGQHPGWCLKAYQRLTHGLRVAPDLFRRSQRLLRAARAKGSERLVSLSCYTHPDDLGGLLEPAALKAVGSYRPTLALAGAEAPDPGGAEFTDATIHSVLPGDYLRKVDVMSSAHGLEVRVPFLGEHVLECAARFDESLKYTSRGSKRLLRRLALRYLPKEIVTRPKRGFSIPLDSWLGRAGREHIRSVLEAPCASLRALIRPRFVKSLLDGFVDANWDRSRRSRYNLYQQVYLLWGLETWLTRWKPTL
jgi:asparagine synthase (glutamine-hydrolysing)